MKRFILASVLAIYPFSYSLHTSEFLIKMEEFGPNYLINHFMKPSGSLNLKDTSHFFVQLRREIKNRFGMDLDLNVAVEESINILIKSGQFSKEEIELAREFYSQILQSEERVLYSRKDKKKPELRLPDHMAIGFAFILGGALLCILPFGVTQGIGTGLVTSGITFVATGVKDGERPHYVDVERDK